MPIKTRLDGDLRPSNQVRLEDFPAAVVAEASLMTLEDVVAHDPNEWPPDAISRAGGCSLVPLKLCVLRAAYNMLHGFPPSRGIVAWPDGG